MILLPRGLFSADHLASRLKQTARFVFIPSAIFFHVFQYISRLAVQRFTNSF